MYPEPTVANLIKYLQEIVEDSPEVAEYTVYFNSDGVWRGKSYRWDDTKFLDLESS